MSRLAPLGVSLLASALLLQFDIDPALAQCDSLIVFPGHTGSSDAVHVGIVSDNSWAPCAPADPNGVNWAYPFDLPFICNNLSCLRIESSGSNNATSEVRLDGATIGYLQTDPGPDCDFVLTELTELTGLMVTPGFHILSVYSNGGPDFAFHDIRFVCASGSTYVCAGDTTLYLPVPKDPPTFALPVRINGTMAMLGPWGFHAAFDSTRLTYDSATAGNWSCFAATPVATDSVRVEGCPPPPFPNNPDTLATLHFLNPDPFTTGTDSVRTDGFFDDFFGLIPCVGEITYVPCGHGDVNNSGILSLEDALCSYKCFLNFGLITPDCDFVGTDCERNAADVNCDGNCTTADALWIADRAFCGGGPIHCGGLGPPCPPSPADDLPDLPGVIVSQVRVGPAEASRGLTVRVPVEVLGTGTLRAFGLDLARPTGMEVVAVDRSPATDNWAGLGLGQQGDVVRLGGFDLAGTPLVEGEWVRLGYLQVTLTAEASGALAFELLDATEDLAGAQWTPAPITIAADEAFLPTEFTLGEPRPNPARGAVSVAFRIPAGAERRVEVTVYDVHGRVVRSLRGSTLPPGEHAADWDGRDDAGRRVAPGAYFFRLQSESFQSTRKIVQMR